MMHDDVNDDGDDDNDNDDCMYVIDHIQSLQCFQTKLVQVVYSTISHFFLSLPSVEAYCQVVFVLCR